MRTVTSCAPCGLPLTLDLDPWALHPASSAESKELGQLPSWRKLPAAQLLPVYSISRRCNFALPPFAPSLQASQVFTFWQGRGGGGGAQPGQSACVFPSAFSNPARRIEPNWSPTSRGTEHEVCSKTVDSKAPLAAWIVTYVLVGKLPRMRVSPVLTLMCADAAPWFPSRTRIATPCAPCGLPLTLDLDPWELHTLAGAQLFPVYSIVRVLTFALPPLPAPTLQTSQLSGRHGVVRAAGAGAAGGAAGVGVVAGGHVPHNTGHIDLTTFRRGRAFVVHKKSMPAQVSLSSWPLQRCGVHSSAAGAGSTAACVHSAR